MNPQRNPECMIVNCAAPVELVAKVKTIIEGRTVPIWTRAGHKPSGKQRPMGISTFFIEAVAKAVEGVEPSPAHREWADAVRAKNRESYAQVARLRWEERRRKRAK